MVSITLPDRSQFRRALPRSYEIPRNTALHFRYSRPSAAESDGIRVRRRIALATALALCACPAGIAEQRDSGHRSGTQTVSLTACQPIAGPEPNTFRWKDIAGTVYSESYQSDYDYSAHGVSAVVEYVAAGDAFQGALTVTNLKPNFAYQLKLVANPDAKYVSELTPYEYATLMRIGNLGRWWDVTTGQINPPFNPDHQMQAYLLFDHSLTDNFGNAVKTFRADSSFHVLFTGSGWYNAVTSTVDPAGPPANDVAYGMPYPGAVQVTVGAQAEGGRPPPGSAFLPPGHYEGVVLLLTEESFHETGLGGYWASAMSGNVVFDIGGCTSNADCDDGQYCNGMETCNTGTQTCEPGSPPDCDDGNGETVDFCAPATGACEHAAAFDPADGTITDSLWVSGMELGGIGVGKLEMRTNGELGNYTINNNWDIRVERTKGTFFAIHVDNAGIKKTVNLRRSYSGGSEYSGVENVDHVRYRGMFPLLEIDYYDDLPIGVRLEAFSPLIPQNPTDSSLPVALYTFRLHNSTLNAVDVSVAMSWENILGRGGYSTWSNGSDTWASIAGNYQQAADTTDLKGLRFQTTQSYGAVRDNAVGEYLLLAEKSADRTITTCSSWNVLDATPSFWPGFSDSGTLTDPVSPPPGTDGSYEPAGTVAVKTSLSPGEEKSVRFLVVWYMPTQITAGDGVNHGHAYLANANTDTADEIAAYAHTNWTRLYDETVEWQQLVLDSNLPFWLKLRMINGAFTMFANGVYTQDLQFYTHESLISMRGSLGTNDQRMCFHPFYTMLFPGLDQNELTIFGDVRPADGRISHFNGNVGWMLHTSNVGYGVTNWPDLSCSYVMQVLKSYKWTGSMSFLDANWPEVKGVMAWLASADGDGDFIPEGGSTYDYEGQNPGAFIYTASAYLGALKAAEELARIKGETTQADAYVARYGNAHASVMSNLWTGTYFKKYHRVTDGAQSPNSFIASLAGDWLSRYSTSGRTLDVDVTKSAENHILNWHQDLFPGVVAPMEVAPDGSDPADNCYQYQHEPYIGMESIYDGFVDEGLEILRSIYVDHWEKARWPWNGRIHPSVYGSGKTGGWNGNYYMSNPATWGVLNALSGSSIDVPNEILYLAPRLPAGWTELHMPLFFPRFWAWLDFNHATGQVDLEIVKTFGSPMTITKTVAELASGTVVQNTSTGLPFVAAEGQILTYNIPVDNTAPASVTDLAAGWTGSAVQLAWTAPGDDGTTGRALRYDIRRSLNSIDDSNWEQATPVTREPYPSPAGAQETFIVLDSVTEGTTHYFALKSKDEEGNWSALSNIESGFAGTAECNSDEDCNDGVDCTIDTCPAGSCVYTPDDGNCPDDGLFCNGTEFCDAVAGCSHTGDPCPPSEVCIEDTDTCGECLEDGDCDDGVACTDDTCVGGSCVFTANDANCPDDGLFCNGREFCDAVADCDHTGDPCAPAQVCDEDTDTCEDCLADGDCDDGVACTDDTCDEGSCVFTPNDANCPDDGLFCNGAEFCEAVGDCSHAGDPCQIGETCDETADACELGTLLTVSYPTTLPGNVTATPAFAALPADPAVTDYVDIGLPASEAGHNMVFTGEGAWGPIVGSDAGGGGYGQIDHARVIWEPASGEAGRSATVDMDFGPAAVDKYVALRWLDGSAFDSFTLEVESVGTTYEVFVDPAYPGGDPDPGEDWRELGVWNVGAVTGVRALTLTATADAWSGQGTYGQVTFDEVAVFADAAECYVDADCDDLNDCTDDTCVDNTCQHANNTLPCEDDQFCNGAEMCDLGTCGAGVPPCLDPCEQCDEVDDVCAWCALDLDHADGVIGTGDFGIFAGCFGVVYPPGHPRYADCLHINFDELFGEAACGASADPNCYAIGTGDFGVFAGCFAKTCSECGSCW